MSTFILWTYRLQAYGNPTEILIPISLKQSSHHYQIQFFLDAAHLLMSSSLYSYNMFKDLLLVNTSCEFFFIISSLNASLFATTPMCGFTSEYSSTVALFLILHWCFLAFTYVKQLQPSNEKFVFVYLFVCFLGENISQLKLF